MKKIIECSSIYAIDFAAVIYSIISSSNDEYIIYINDVAETKSEYREFISRLALPTFNWKIDPQGQLRQIHIPINDLKKKEFMEAVCNAFKSYSEKEELSENYFKILIQKLSEFVLDYDNYSIEAYKLLIEQIIELVTGKKIDIMNFANIRMEGDINNAKKFLKSVYNDILKLPQGNFKFLKGGKIEVYIEDKWIKISKFKKQENICFYAHDGTIYSFEEICSVKKIRFRGPLETIFLCEYGKLIDLPWYLDADLSDNFNYDYMGIEYISPISVSSFRRVSKVMKGDGKRLVPCGYSLIEYESDKVLGLLKKLYKEKSDIHWDDLKDWRMLINNYPVTFQKVAKSQTSVYEWCNTLLEYRFKEVTNGLVFEKLEYKNFVMLGVKLVDACVIMKLLRLVSNPKSPYYCNLGDIDNFYLDYEKKEGLNELYRDILMIIDRCLNFFENFQYRIECVIDCKKEVEKSAEIFENSLVNCESIFQNKEFSHVVSKIEGKIKKCLYTYYELAIFISGVLLKANIFTGYCVLGEDYANCIRKIIAQREIKYLYFTPIYIGGEKNV